MAKRGDTLIEVTLAIGIFSMVAISIVAVMSGGTARAQTSLETTLAREEIDAQAEALRFIQNAAVAEKTAETQPFYNLWKSITNLAFSASELPDSEKNYAPTNCANVYDSKISDANEKMFVLDYKKLGEFIKDKDNKVQILVTNTDAKISPSLTATTTYPRLVYGTKFDKTEEAEETGLITDPGNNLVSAEGIYIVAAAADDSKTPEYYDFYIRSCWYGINADSPSTVSTVVRLYNPDAINN